jgi:NAD(P)-dependent dehydrogenase (short-subunit alcohol dehydrogenase family)
VSGALAIAAGHRVLVWFSCGAASAAAAKLAIETYGDACEVVYCDTLGTEHPDNARFFADVERWIGRPITVIRSEKYADIDDVFQRTRFMAGIAGARCTTELKKLPRIAFQRDTDTHVFGYTSEEARRAVSFEEANPALVVEWLLIERGITKRDCLDMLRAAGIALPAMYGLGFDHNNCLACPKATSPGYWNRTRRLFLEVFERRARQSRLLGVRLVRVKGVRMFLDELPPEADAPDDDIDCGPVCHAPSPDLQIPLFRRSA